MVHEGATSRRAFFKECFAGAVALGAAAIPAGMEPSRSTYLPEKSRVVVVRDPRLRESLSPNESKAPEVHGTDSKDPHRIRALLDEAMRALSGSNDAQSPWTQLVHPGQRVGLKVNALGGRGLSTNTLLAEAICERLCAAGIRTRDIVIWDRDSWELERAGFRIRTGGDQVQCFGSDRSGYDERLASFGSVGSRISKIVTERCDVLINVPVLKDHDGAGVTIALKNMYGAIHNPNKYHPNGCDPYVADVNALPELREKLCLHICDATTACFEGGPSYKPQFAWRANSLLVSTDPVALDQTGWRMIEDKRATEGLKPLAAENRTPTYIATAADAQHRLGHNDWQQIAVVETQVT